MRLIKYFVCVVFFLSIESEQYAQSMQPFQLEIDAFKKQDSIHPPIKHPILFIGSSSFTKWKSINNDFPGFPILNRGFGGSQLTDVIHFAEETIFKYHPKQIFIYCGENDLAMDVSVTPQMVLERYKTLHHMIRDRLGKRIPIVFVSLKPSIARWKLENKYVETNQLIASFLKSDKHTTYVDVHEPMLDKNKEVLKDIFIEDNLHMNAKGYAIWIKIIGLHLNK